MGIEIGGNITIGGGITIGDRPLEPVYLIAENNDFLISESGDNFVTE